VCLATGQPVQGLGSRYTGGMHISSPALTLDKLALHTPCPAQSGNYTDGLPSDPDTGGLALGPAYLLRPESEVYNIAELSEESCEAQTQQDRVVTYQLLRLGDR
jgi:hypothetical protein